MGYEISKDESEFNGCNSCGKLSLTHDSITNETQFKPLDVQNSIKNIANNSCLVSCMKYMKNSLNNNSVGNKKEEINRNNNNNNSKDSIRHDINKSSGNYSKNEIQENDSKSYKLIKNDKLDHLINNFSKGFGPKYANQQGNHFDNKLVSQSQSNTSHEIIDKMDVSSSFKKLRKNLETITLNNIMSSLINKDNNTDDNSKLVSSSNKSLSQTISDKSLIANLINNNTKNKYTNSLFNTNKISNLLTIFFDKFQKSVQNDTKEGRAPSYTLLNRKTKRDNKKII
jgi:hypothetical protein